MLLIIRLEVKLWPRIGKFVVPLELYLLHNMFWNVLPASSKLTDGPQNYLTGKSGVLIKYQKKLTDLKWAGITQMFLSDKCNSGVRVCRPCWLIVDKSAFFWKGCEMRAEVVGNSLGRGREREARGDAERFDVTNFLPLIWVYLTLI